MMRLRSVQHVVNYYIRQGAGMDNEHTRSIVYIEDDPEMIDLVTLIVNKRGFQIKGAHGGRNGLDTVRKEKPALVLLDLMMPDMDGWDVYQQLKSGEDTRDIPVIIITAKAQSIDRVLGLHIAKVDDYISKPFRPQELLDSIEHVLQATE
jgi:two-component system response regulator VicR